MQRLLRNLGAPSGPCAAGVSGLVSPAHRLQREADRRVPALFTPERLDELLGIPGFSSPRELHLLAYLATRAPGGGCLLEIGAYKGRSTAWLVEAAQLRADKPAVVSIDPHHRDTWETFQNVVAQFCLRERGLEVMRGFRRRGPTAAPAHLAPVGGRQPRIRGRVAGHHAVHAPCGARRLGCVRRRARRQVSRSRTGYRRAHARQLRFHARRRRQAFRAVSCRAA